MCACRNRHIHVRRVYEGLSPACKQAINEAAEESNDPSLHRVSYKNVTECVTPSKD